MTDTPGRTPPGSPGPEEPDEPGRADEPPIPEAPPEAAKGPAGQTDGTPHGWAPQQPPPGWGPPPQGWTPPGGNNPYAGGWGGSPYMQAAKPGVVPLRPLTVGEIISGALETVRTNWKLMMGTAFGVALATQVVNVPLQWLIMRNVDPDTAKDVASGSATSTETHHAAAAVFGSEGLTVAFQLVGTFVLTGMVTVIVGRAAIGRRMTARQAWVASRRYVWRLAGVYVMTGLIVGGLVVACLAPGALVSIVSSSSAGGSLLAMGTFAAVVLGVRMYVLLSLAGPALMLEKSTVSKALTRSQRLVRGNWWRVLGVQLIVGIMTGVVAGIIQGVAQAVFGNGFGQVTAGLTFAEQAAIGIAAVIAYTLTFPVVSSATALLYIDQRMRREGLDLELAKAAGLVPDSVA